MNYTSNLAKHFTNTPHQRRTRLSLAARTFQQQDQQEQDLAENTLAPRPSYGRPNKRARQTNFTGDKALARQSDYNKLSSDPLSIFAPQLEQLSRSVIALESNFQHLGGINEALTTFNDAFDTFLRAMSINAQCVIFPEAPNPLSFKRQPQEQPEDANMLGASIYPSTAQTVLSSSAEPVNNDEAHYLANLSYAQDISTGTFLDNTFASTEESVKSKIPVRKKRAAKAAPPPKPFPMKKLIEGLPLRYRDSPHRDTIEIIVKALHSDTEGLYIHQIVKLADVARHRCIEYMNALVHSKNVLKISRKGFLYQLDPVKYPPNKMHRR